MSSSASNQPTPATGPLNNIAGLSGKRILFVSFHFYPSNAVGSRRMSELARYLTERGVEVQVVSGPATGNAAAGDVVQGARLVRVAPPKRKLSAILIRGKRFAARLFGRGWPTNSTKVSAGNPGRPVAGVVSSDGHGHGHGAPSPAETVATRLRRYWDSLLWVNDDQKGWALKAIMTVRRLALEFPYDLVISSGPPMSGHWVGRYAAAKRRVSWIMDCRDPWGDNSDWVPHIHSPLKQWLETVQERYCVARATRITCASEPIAAQLCARYGVPEPKVGVILNGFDGDLLAAPPVLGAMRLLYAGSIYLHRDPSPIIEAIGTLVAEGIADPALIRFDLIGHTPPEFGRELTALIERHGLSQVVRLSPAIPRDELMVRYEDANVLINLAQGQAKQIPAKMFEYLQQRRDILVMTEPDSATALLVNQLTCCHVVHPADTQQLRQVLTDLYHRLVIARRPSESDADSLKRFSRKHSNEAFARDIQSLVG